ncbi:MAG: peptidyl-tRNA hydrolase [Candidatus Saccharibacteria bacterium]|nr:peptidyl-tRNA hydrolase [Candidatus Saccharibacteria bacterium]
MKIVFAQGNPDKKYQKTRHNTGFMIVDALGEKYDATWRVIDKYKGHIANIEIDGEKVILVKPLSYYNDTGMVARLLVDYYKLNPATDFLVVHDDLALPLGTIRVRDSGSDAGNNGVKDLNLHLGQNYKRIRVGIWTEDRDKMDDVNFVLGVFPKAEFEKVEKVIIPHVTDLIEKFVAGTLEVSSASL